MITDKNNNSLSPRERAGVRAETGGRANEDLMGSPQNARMGQDIG